MAQAKKSGPGWDSVELAPVVLIKSKEEALTDRVRHRLIAQARQQDPEIEVVKLDAGDYPAGELAVLASPSLFGGAKLGIVTGLESMSDAFLQDALELVAHPSPDLFLVAVRSMKSRSAARGVKLDKAIESASFPVVDIPELKYDSDKIDLLRADASRAGRKVNEDALRMLVDSMGSDIREMTSALRQLIDDTSGTITTTHVNTYYGGRIEATGYAVADAVVEGNLTLALQQMRHALSTGTHEVAIVSALAFKFRDMAKVSATMGRDGRNIKLSMAPWQVDRAKRSLRNWSDEALARAISAIAKADADVKGFRGEARDATYSLEKCIRVVTAARRL